MAGKRCTVSLWRDIKQLQHHRIHATITHSSIALGLYRIASTATECVMALVINTLESLQIASAQRLYCSVPIQWR